MARLAARDRGWLGRLGPVMLAGLGLAAVLAPPSAPADGRKIKLEGRYVYEDACGIEMDVNGLEGAEVIVKSGKKTIRRRFDDFSAVKLKLPGKPKKIRATVVLDGDLLEVREYGEKEAYRFTKTVKLKGKGDPELSLRGLDEAGAAHVWTILAGAAIASADALPAGSELPKVIARYEPGRGPSAGLPDLPGTETSYHPPSRQIFVDSRVNADQFEDDILYHEYGHHLLYSVAHPGPGTGGEHYADSSYPDRPAMAWDEGFAQAFGAIVGNDPTVMRGCVEHLDLGAQPATPTSTTSPWLNQYHEVSVAGALFGVAKHLGGGLASDGLKPLLGALVKFHKRYGGPSNTRDARDALIEAGLEPTANEHLAITKQFSDQQIKWFFRLSGVETDSRSGGSNALKELNFTLQGPYGACTVTDDLSQRNVPLTGMAPDEPSFWGLGSVGREGGLPYTSRDDCVVHGGDGRSPYSWKAASLMIAFPYLPDQGHAGAPYTLTATWVCEGSSPQPEYQCTANRLHNFILETGPLHSPTGARLNTTVSLGRNVATDLVQFEANGKCTWLPTGEDCRF